MDSSSSSHLPLPPLLLSSFLLIITVSSILFLLLKLWKEVSKQHESAAAAPLPPGPRKLPIIGNLHQLLAGSKLPHHRLRQLANAHGPLMHLQLGQLQTIVVSSAETAKQVYKTHDLTFSNRPHLLLVDIIFRNRDLAFAPYGDYWRQLRKLCVLELLSAKRVHSFGPIREQEVSRLVDDVRCCKRSAAVNITAMIFSLTYRIISRAAFGKLYKELESSFVQLTMEMIEIGSGFGVADVFPSWKFLLLVTGVRSRLQKLKRESDRILHSIIEEHRAAAKAGESVKEEEEDLVDVLFKVQQNGDLGFKLTTESVTAVLLELFFAGSETSSTALEWAMTELVRDERVMKKAQDEIRAVFEKSGKVEEERIHELNYLKMVIKESLRLHPPLPLLAPRESREPCELGGYGIPEKTKVIVNAWAIGRDPKYWSEPERFYPERFLDATSVDYKGNDFEFIPFGAGRRVCPGISFSISSVETALANLLFHFDWKLPQGMKPESLDMDELFGATIRRKNDLHLIPTVWQP